MEGEVIKDICDDFKYLYGTIMLVPLLMVTLALVCIKLCGAVIMTGSDSAINTIDEFICFMQKHIEKP